MRIADRSGHNQQAQGAIAILNEVTEDRKILDSVNKWLKIDKNEILDVTPGPCTSSQDLAYGVNKSNTYKPDLFASFHENCGGGHGVEVLYHPNSAIGKQLATRVCNSIAKLGFTNRGAKADVRGLYELNHTNAPAIIVESFFLDSASDVILYQKIGVDKLGKAIAEGIVNHEIKETVSKVDKKVLLLQQVCNRCGIRGSDNKPLVEDGISGPNTDSAKAKLKIYIAEVTK